MFVDGSLIEPFVIRLVNYCFATSVAAAKCSHACTIDTFMKDTKGKELKHNAVETSGRLASYYYFSTS